MNLNSYIDQPVSKRQETVYLRTYSRNIPSSQLQSYLDARPVQTKYSKMPIIDLRKTIETPLIQQATYNINSTFNPGNNKAPWAGYAANVNDESTLRNQVFALQSCGQSTYIPSSKSILYNVKWENQKDIKQPFPGLFKKEQFSPVNPNKYPDKIGYALFNNATRQQIKDF
jgi:hypothetical protein